MLVLTPAERRGAALVVVLLLIGTAHDLWTAHRREQAAPTAEPVLTESSVVTAPVDSAQATPARNTSSAALLDLNLADREQLDALPGIGPVLAGRILEQRARVGRFRAPEELLAVRGIGPTLYRRLEDRVTVGARQASPRASEPGSDSTGHPPRSDSARRP